MGKTLVAVGAALILWTCAGPIAGGESDDPAATNPGGKTDTVGGEGTGGAIPNVDGGAADLGREEADADADGEVAEGDGSVGEAPGDAETMVDPYAQALDVHLHQVTFPEGTPASAYQWPRVDTGFSLGGTEFWQRWPGGLMPTYSYSEGTEWGSAACSPAPAASRASWPIPLRVSSRSGRSPSGAGRSSTGTTITPNRRAPTGARRAYGPGART